MFRARDLLVRQRTQLINAIRGHLTEYGWIAPKGPAHVAMLGDLLEQEEMASSLPEAARAMFRLMLDLLAGLDGKIADLDTEIARRAREDEVSRRLMTVPGIGPISATASPLDQSRDGEPDDRRDHHELDEEQHCPEVGGEQIDGDTDHGAPRWPFRKGYYLLQSSENGRLARSQENPNHLGWSKR